MGEAAPGSRRVMAGTERSDGCSELVLRLDDLGASGDVACVIDPALSCAVTGWWWIGGPTEYEIRYALDQSGSVLPSVAECLVWP